MFCTPINKKKLYPKQFIMNRSLYLKTESHIYRYGEHHCCKYPNKLSTKYKFILINISSLEIPMRNLIYTWHFSTCFESGLLSTETMHNSNILELKQYLAQLSYMYKCALKYLIIILKIYGPICF